MSPNLGIIASSISGNLVTNSYESIATVTIGSGGASNVEFTSIPSTYTHLQIRGISRFSNLDTDTGLVIQLNSDTGSNYSQHLLRGSGSATYAGGNASQTYMVAGTSVAGSSTASVFSGTIFDVLDYKNTNKYKTVRYLSGFDANGSGYINFASGLWMNTNAVTSIKIFSSQSYNLGQYSSFALYGIKGA